MNGLAILKEALATLGVALLCAVVALAVGGFALLCATGIFLQLVEVVL